MQFVIFQKLNFLENYDQLILYTKLCLKHYVGDVCNIYFFPNSTHYYSDYNTVQYPSWHFDL